MYRLFEEKLALWKGKKMKKPLMVIGARQIGKTYIIEEFCKNNFPNYIYFNLEKEREIAEIFEKTINPEEIIAKIEVRVEKNIDIDSTILFFDEVQVSEKFIMSLKYFCESTKNYKIICAGSLLGVKLNRFGSSFPVGKVDIMYMHPMNFKEFLMACGQNKLIEEIENHYKSMEAMDNDLHEKALLYYKHFLIVGGMPEVVNDYVKNDQNILAFDRNILKLIIDMYISDMNKYTFNKPESAKTLKVFNSIPKELAKENKKFQYSIIEASASKRKFETALDWLSASSLILNCYNVTKVEIPLKVYLDYDYF